MIIPTGLGCAMGGHAGDATPAARLLAEACDKLIVHPNVVNASDINEMTDNMLYVEGSQLDRFLEGEIELQEVRRANRILIVTNTPVRADTINAMNAARVTLGADIRILGLNTPLTMAGCFLDSGQAEGLVEGWCELVEQVSHHLSFDALAIHTPISVPRDVALTYFREGGVNPWGGVEAKASKLIASQINKPVAHAPTDDIDPEDAELYRIGLNEAVDPRIAPEVLSTTYLHCVLKGLHRAPQIGSGLSRRDVDFLITPVGCWGRPHRACLREIEIIAVRENTTCLNKEMPEDGVTLVDTYLEAAGVILARRAGVSLTSVRVGVE